MDIRIENDNKVFKFRVCGILKVKEKYLAVKINQNDFYCLPGGHVELGEDTNTAVMREMKEEIGVDVKINRLASIMQSFFKTKNGKTVHELAYYYIVEPVNIKDVNTNDYEVLENDKGIMKTLSFKWFTIEELKQVKFMPKALIEKLTSTEIESVILND